MHLTGRLLIITGVVIIIIGLVFTYFDKIPFLGKLPGDIDIKGKNYSIYIPIATSIIISIILSLIFYVISKIKNQ